MAIMRKKVLAAKDVSTSTHFENETTKKADDSDQAMLNHQVWNTLIDPEDDEEGSTHFLNEEKYNDKSKRQNASVKKPTKVVKATTEADPDAHTGEDLTKPEAEYTTDVAAGNAEEDKQFMDNDEDPAAGYLTVGEFDEEEDAEDEDETEEVNAAEEELEHAFAPQSLLDTDNDDLSGSTHFKNLEVDSPESRRMNAAAEEDDEEEEEDEMDDWGSKSGGGGSTYEASTKVSADEMPIVDIDGMDDSEGEGVEFATAGLRVHAIKANRIIATISKKAAVTAGHGDVYLSDQFQDVVGVEMAKHGIRAGLQAMGFTLATVNVAKVEVINKRVEAKVKQVTAAVRRTSHAQTEAFEQCAAIAAVGINRQYFKDTQNELRAALEEELQAAGVRGATKLVRRVFASKGVAYAKAIVTLATKLQAMPEATRNTFAEALDMTSDGEQELDDENLYGDSASPNFQAMYTADSMEDGEFADEFDEEVESPSTVHAALSRPLKKMSISASKTGYSVTAAAILSGDVPFPY
jgi:hypothetical protein